MINTKNILQQKPLYAIRDYYTNMSLNKEANLTSLGHYRFRLVASLSALFLPVQVLIIA